LIAIHPEFIAIIEETLPNNASSTANKAVGPAKDFREAERVVKLRGLTEAIGNEFGERKETGRNHGLDRTAIGSFGRRD
jgi:hypothetical protein